MRISDWSSDVCSSDLNQRPHHPLAAVRPQVRDHLGDGLRVAQRGHALIQRLTQDSHPARQAREEQAWAKQGKADRKSGVEGKSVAVSVDLGGRRIIKKKKIKATKMH